VDSHIADRIGYVAASTIQVERERSKPLKAFFASTRVSRISADLIREYINHRKQDGMANKTVNLELELVRAVLKRAKRWTRIVDEIKFLPTEENVGRALELDEKLRLLKVAPRCGR